MAKGFSTPDLRAISSPARAQRSPGRALAFQSLRSPGRGARGEDASTGCLANVSQCRMAWSSAVRAEMQAGLHEVQRERVRVAELRDELQSTRALLQDARHDKAQVSKRREDMQEAAAATASRIEGIERARDQLVEEHQRQVQELRFEEDAVQQKREAAEQRRHEIEQFVGLYEKTLGLSIVITAPETVKFTFNLLDPTDLARGFCFVLGTASADGNTGDTYTVTGCTPSVPNLRALVNTLNKEAHTDTAMPAFMCAMRQAFKNVATGSKTR